jgi:allophanate hydrolase subunit 2
MDLLSLAVANLRAGNPPGLPALEMTLAGAELEALEDTVVAVAGADAPLERNGMPSGFSGGALRLRSGDRLRVGHVRRGARTYLGARGGFAERLRTEPTARVTAGEILHVRAPGGSAGASPSLPDFAHADGPIRLRAVPGPEAATFDPSQLRRFFSTLWEVSTESDRRGLRLAGPPLEHGGTPEIPPSGTVPGTVQVPGSGLPIILGPDGPVTGGYPRLAAVIGADLWRLGQAPPGATLRFEAVTFLEAASARRAAGSTITLP